VNTTYKVNKPLKTLIKSIEVLEHLTENFYQTKNSWFVTCENFIINDFYIYY